MAQKSKKEGIERFQGMGIDFKAKIIGIEKVDDARGDRMCQEAMGKLKALVKASGEHKQRIIINISIEGLKILDEKTGSINHHHEVHKISFISRAPTDNRAFGYIYGEASNHQFFGIKTEKAAENVVLALKDLFQVVLELKTKQMEEQKRSMEQTTLHLSSSYDDPLYEIPIGQEKAATQENSVIVSEGPPATSETPEDVNALYAVPHKLQKPEETAASGNLLDLAEEVKTLQLGINDMDQFSFDPINNESTNQIKSVDSAGSKSPNPFQMSNSWSTDLFSSPDDTRAAPAQRQPATDFGTAFGDPFVVATSTSQSNSANLFAEFADAFSPPTTTAAPSTTANPFGNNFGNTAFGAPAPNAFGAPSPFGAPASNAFGGAAFGAPASNTFQANFSMTSQAPAMQSTDPFGDPFMIGGPLSANSSQGAIGQPLAPTTVPTTKESTSKPDPFGDLGLINSSSSKTGKDMFANFQMAKPGEVAMPDIMPVGMPDRPPPAVPSSTDGNLDSDSSPVDSHEKIDVPEDFNLPPPQVPPPTLPPSFNALEELDAPPPPPPRPRNSLPNTASVAIPPRPARPSTIQNLNSNHAERSDLSPTTDLFSRQQLSLPCNWSSDSLETNIDNKNFEGSSNSSGNLDSSNLFDNQNVFDPFNLHSNNGSTAAQPIPSQCISNHPSNSHSSSLTSHFLNKPPLPNGTNVLSSSLPTSEKVFVKMSTSKSTSSISSLQTKASLPIHEDPFADDPFASSSFTTSVPSHSSTAAVPPADDPFATGSFTTSVPSHSSTAAVPPADDTFATGSFTTSVSPHSSTAAVPPPLPSRPKLQSSVNNGNNPVVGTTTTKPTITTSDGVALFFDDSPFGL